MIKITHGKEKPTDQRVSFRFDKEALKRIRAKHPDIQIGPYLREYLLRLDDAAPIIQVKEPEGIRVKCRHCGYSWIYTGSMERVKCNRCGKKLRTHLYG